VTIRFPHNISFGYQYFVIVTAKRAVGSATIAACLMHNASPCGAFATVHAPFTQEQEFEMASDNDWSAPKAMAIPREGYFTLQPGRYGATYPRTPACHGFTIIAKIKPGTEEEIRAYGMKIEQTIAASPHALAPLQLHYLRWVLFDIGADKYFMYQGIFDTDFDKYTEDAIELFKATGVDTVFEKLEGFPVDWKTNPSGFIKFIREHQHPSFLEYGEYPYVSAGEIKKALAMKQAFSSMLDHMQ